MSSSTVQQQSPINTSPPVPPQQSASNLQRYHHEDRLSLTWRTIASSFVYASQKAEKAAADPSEANMKEIDDAVVTFLKNRHEWSRLISYLEAKLEGKAKEMEILQHYHQSQPRFRKRKRVESVHAAATTVASVEPANQGSATTATT
jgi:hypothetical protein